MRINNGQRGELLNLVDLVNRSNNPCESRSMITFQLEGMHDDKVYGVLSGAEFLANVRDSHFCVCLNTGELESLEANTPVRPVLLECEVKPSERVTGVRGHWSDSIASEGWSARQTGRAVSRELHNEYSSRAVAESHAREQPSPGMEPGGVWAVSRAINSQVARGEVRTEGVTSSRAIGNAEVPPRPVRAVDRVRTEGVNCTYDPGPLPG